MADENVAGAGTATDSASAENAPVDDNVIVTTDDINKEWDIPAEKSEAKPDGPDDKKKPDDQKPAGPEPEKPGSEKPEGQKSEDDEVFKSSDDLIVAYDKLKAEKKQAESFIQTLKSENKEFRGDREVFNKQFNDLMSKLEANAATGSGKEPTAAEKKSILEKYSEANPAVAKALDGLTGTLGEADVANLNTILTAISEDTNTKITQRDERDQIREDTKTLTEAAERFPESKNPEVQKMVAKFSESDKDQDKIDPAFLADIPYHYARSNMIESIVERMVNKLLPERAMAEAKKMVASGAVVGVGTDTTKPGTVADTSKKTLDAEWGV